MGKTKLCVGLTGGIGSGKSAASHWFEEHGIYVVDADIVAREVVQPGSTALNVICQHFGNEALQADGSLNRSLLRQFIFNDQQERQWLEALLHPIIRREITHQLKSSESPYTVLSSPLLLETDQYQLVGKIIVVDLPEELQKQRAGARDSSPCEQIQKIIDAQLPREKRLAHADFILDNSQTRAHLYQQLQALHNALLKSVQRDAR